MIVDTCLKVIFVRAWLMLFLLHSKLHTVASPKRLKVSYKPKVSGLPPAKKRKREHSLEDELQPIVMVCKTAALQWNVCVCVYLY